MHSPIAGVRKLWDAPCIIMSQVLSRDSFKAFHLEHAHLETLMNLKSIGLAGIAAAMFAIPAVAHHSFAMFDAEKIMSLEGTVKEFQWTNPHAWILLNAPKAQGTE